MAKNRVNREELKATLKVVGLLTHIEKKYDDQGEFIYLRVRYGQTTIFVYERKPVLIRRIEKYQVDDVIEVLGNFLCPSYMGQKKGRLPVIDNVIEVRNIGILKKEKSK